MPKKKKFQLKLLLPLLSIPILLSTATYTYIHFHNTQKAFEEKNNVVEILEEEEKQTEEISEKILEDTTAEDEITLEEAETEDNVITKTETTTPKPSVEKESTPEPTPEPESPSAYVAFYADNQSDNDQEDANHLATVNRILSSGANPVFHAGDLMEDGTQNSLDRFNTVTTTLRATRTFYAAIGNNDRKVGDSTTPSQLYLDNFSFPNNELWYSVNYGNLHMVVLDSAFNASNATQRSWLQADLQSSASQDRITGVMFHHPTFADTIAQDLVDYGVDFVIMGHYHSYNHSVKNGINHFIMSGQPTIGYVLMRVYSNDVSMTVYNHNGTVVENIAFDER